MKILILENDATLDKGSSISKWINKKKAEGDHEFKIITRAYSNKKEIIKHINWPDILAFSTTFIYIYEIMALTQGIANHRKNELTILIKNDEVDMNIARIVNIASDRYNPKEECFEPDAAEADKFAHSLKKLKIYQMDWLDDQHRRVTILDKMIKREQARLDKLESYMKSRHEESARTGRWIKIRTFGYNPGPEWSKLKTGMVVPEINMTHVDRQPERGVWVMGLTEPVKLLNESPYDEYEIVVRNEYDLAEELIKKCNAQLSPINVMAVIGILKETELAPHWKATEIIDMLGAERRHTRSIITERIEAFENTPVKIFMK